MTTLTRWMNQPFYGLSWPVRNVLLAGLAIPSLILLLCILYFNASATPSLNSALCAGWAVRADQNIYHVTSDHGDVFHGAPIVAILLSPLGQPPAQSSMEGILPRPIALFLMLLVLATALCLTVHRLACYLESQQEASPTTIDWWHHRLTPMLLCAGPIYASLSQLHSDAIILFLLTGWLLAAVGHRSFQSGCWLAGAIAVKLFPVYLLIMAIFRRDRLMTLGTVGGLALSLILLPGIFFGFQRTSRLNELYLTNIKQQTKTIPTAESNLSLAAVLHRFQGQTREPQYYTIIHLALIGLLTMASLLAMAWSTSPKRLLHLGNALIIVMMVANPVCKLHHFCLLLPVLMTLTASISTQKNNAAAWMSVVILFLVSVCLFLPATVHHTRLTWLPLPASLTLWAMQVQVLLCTRFQVTEKI